MSAQEIQNAVANMLMDMVNEQKSRSQQSQSEVKK